MHQMGKVFSAIYEDKFAYTSPNFMYEKRFPTRIIQRHIDINNPEIIVLSWRYYYSS